jgi:hypothetical protein
VCRYAECRYAMFRYAECCGAVARCLMRHLHLRFVAKTVATAKVVTLTLVTLVKATRI